MEPGSTKEGLDNLEEPVITQRRREVYIVKSSNRRSTGQPPQINSALVLQRISSVSTSVFAMSSSSSSSSWSSSSSPRRNSTLKHFVTVRARPATRAVTLGNFFLGDFEHSRLALFFGSPVHNLASKCFLFCRLCCSNVQCLAKFPQGEEKRRGRKFSNLQHFPSTPVRRGSVLSQIRCTRIPIFPFGLSIGHPKDQLQQIFSSGSVNPKKVQKENFSMARGAPIDMELQIRES